MKDPRYKAIKSLIDTKSIQGLQDIFEVIPITIVKTDLGVHYNTLRRRIDKSELLTLKDIISLAELFEVEPVEIFKLSVIDYNKRKKRNVKKR
ncbi:MAG: hypothetical protein H0V30_08300 [Chitinophagaceae bacterium]|nr:hypothetical protein [Chitinophagaceae bacterium]